MQVAVIGAGRVGRRVAEHLAGNAQRHVVLVSHRRAVAPLAGVTVGVGWPHPAATNPSIVVLATEAVHQFSLARQLIRDGRTVIATASSPEQIERLLTLNELAARHDTALIVGAAYSPGVSTLLATHLARGFDHVSSIRTAHFGTGGPACAREHHRAMGTAGPEIRDGQRGAHRGGTGRELVWFPDPVGAADCYRAGLADPLLLRRAFPDVPRIEARQAATRRDRLTSRLPMLRAPHAEGLVGAVWAEVRGRIEGRVEHRSMAVTGPPASGAAAVVAALCIHLEQQEASLGALSASSPRPKGGCQIIPEFEDLVSLLVQPSNRMRLWAYDGSKIEIHQSDFEPIRAARKWKLTNDIRINTTIL